MPKAKPDATLQAMDTKPVEPAKIGRPTVMIETTRLEICARIAGGETLTHVCKDPRMPARQTVTNYLAGKDAELTGFANRYRRARESLLDVYADDIVTISDDGTTDYVIKTGRNGHEYKAVDQEHIQRSRLRVDSRKWILSKLRPEQYGDRVEQVATGTVAVVHDFSSMSDREKMRRLALFMVEDQRLPAIEGQLDSQPANESKTQPDEGINDDVPSA